MNTLEKTFRKIGLGLLLIVLYVKIGKIDLLADWIGYLLIFISLPELKKQSKYVSYLKVSSFALLGFSFIDWILNIFNSTILFFPITWIYTILRMVLYYYLFKELAEIVHTKEPKIAFKIKFTRNVILILESTSLLSLTFLQEIGVYISLTLSIVIVMEMLYMVFLLYKQSNTL